MIVFFLGILTGLVTAFIIAGKNYKKSHERKGGMQR